MDKFHIEIEVGIENAHALRHAARASGSDPELDTLLDAAEIAITDAVKAIPGLRMLASVVSRVAV